MKIIDWEEKGHLVRFYLGKDRLDYWTGDDWDDIPYYDNAGQVYKEYIKDYRDIVFDFNCELSFCQHQITKKDLRDKKFPFLTIHYKNYKKSQGKAFYLGDKISFRDNYCTVLKNKNKDTKEN